METNYQSKQVKEQMNQLETLIPSSYRRDLDIKDKENISKDIYECIGFFEKLIYEAGKELKYGKK